MAELRVKKDSFLYGIIYSDLDHWLLQRYDELITELFKYFESRKDEKVTAKIITYLKSSLNSKIADNKELIRKFDLLINIEKIPANEISLNQIRKNNLLSINEKAECLINDLSIIRDQISNPQKKKGLATYQWLTNPDKELPELYKRMIDGKFIAKTDLEAFRAIFTGQPVESITTKLKWLSSKVLLAYFIDSIRNKIPMATDIWKVAKNCFENVEYLKNSQQGYINRKAGKPQLPLQHKLIDDLLKDL